ncbi:MAG: cell division ATP-binding protein FtsE [Nitrospinota bacterium]|nr:MAG: cell division ATP-binding protein FtsE [Nitrospinota bacterium]
MVRLFHVYKSYGERHRVLKDLSLVVEQGEFVFVTGPSGAGKSTLLRLLYGAEKADRGQIVVNGRNLSRLRRSTIPALRRTLGIVFQDFKLLSRRTVYDNVAVVLRVLGKPEREIRQRVWQVLQQVGLQQKRDMYPYTLSGGEQQRLAIARALVHQPSLLLADEPTGNLDREMSREILTLFQEAHGQGTTVIVATHDLSLVEAFPFRQARLYQGTIVED